MHQKHAIMLFFSPFGEWCPRSSSMDDYIWSIRWFFSLPMIKIQTSKTQHWLNGLRSDITFQKPAHLGSYSVNRCLFTVYKHTWLSPPWHLLGSPLNLPSLSWAWPLWSKSWWGGDPGARPPSTSEGSRPGRSPNSNTRRNRPQVFGRSDADGLQLIPDTEKKSQYEQNFVTTMEKYSGLVYRPGELPLRMHSHVNEKRAEDEKICAIIDGILNEGRLDLSSNGESSRTSIRLHERQKEPWKINTVIKHYSYRYNTA